MHSGTGVYALAKRVPRQFLHAAELRFTHPRTGAPMRFESPLPPDLAAEVRRAIQSAPKPAPAGGA